MRDSAMRRLVLVVFIGVIGVVFVTAWHNEHRPHPSDGCPPTTTRRFRVGSTPGASSSGRRPGFPASDRRIDQSGLPPPLQIRTCVRYLRSVVATPISPTLPRRDEHARAQLRAAATRAAPAVLAGDRLLAVPGLIGELLPAGGIRRGSTVALDGPPGAGSTTVAFLLAAATTSVGEWAAVVDPDGTFGARAAAEMGV